MKKSRKSSTATEIHPVALDLVALRAVTGGGAKARDAYFVKVDRSA